MWKFLEQLVALAWNRLRFPAQRKEKDSPSAISLGLRVVEGAETSRRITVSQARRATHTGAFGKTGSGKSFWVKHCAAQDVAANRGGLFIDFHGDLTPFLLSAIAEKEWRDNEDLSDRVILISPSDPDTSVGLNPLEGLATDFVRSTEFTEILKQRYNLDALGARTDELLRNSIVVLAANGLTLLELALLLSDDRFRAQCLEHTPNTEVRDYFEFRFGKVSEPMKATMREPILNKTSAFTADPRFRHIVGQAKSSFSMKDAMDRNCWILAYLPKGELGAQALTFASLLFTVFKNAIFTRERKNFFPAYFDEFQNLISQSTDIETVLSEARKFGVGIVAVNQFLGQFPSSMREAMLSVGTHVCFQLSSADAGAVSQMFDGGKALAEQLKNLPPRHFIVKSGSDHWTEGIVPNVEAKKTSYRDLVDRARKIYARPRADIEREIIERRNNKGSKPNEDLHNWD
ncbi:MAG: hypothetical protein ABSD39_20455 [Terriglobales bacterium]|jgi:hypothetical protein